LGDSNSEKAFFYENSNNNSENNDIKTIKTIKNNNEQNEQVNENENEDKKFTDCYFRQDTKGYFHMPTLVKIEQKPQIKKEFKKQKTYLGGSPRMYNPFVKKSDKKTEDIFWDPEIDSNTLSYINHNFISIEDIYNGKNLEDKNDKNTNDSIENEEIEPYLTPIKAKEIFFDKDGRKSFHNIFGSNDKQEMDHGDGDKLKDEFKNDNKFIEYIAINPAVETFEYQMEANIKEEREFTELLKKDFHEKTERISAYELKEFPRTGNLRPKNIERYLRFKMLAKYDQDSTIEITLQPKNTSDKNDTIESKNSLDDLDENDVFQIGKINNLKDKDKDKSFSAIEENKSYLDEGENNATHKNLNSFNSEESLNKDKKSELNFNDESQIYYSSEKSKSKSKSLSDYK
jgi:hypothetical protein